MISDLAWEPVTVDAIHLAFLRAERKEIALAGAADHHLLDAPDLSNSQDNSRRRELLHKRRGPLLEKVPADTAWFAVRYLEREHLGQLLAIGGNCGWDDPADRNELLLVAKRKTFVLSTPPEGWNEPILWGHTRNGPFTILEGNKRLTAYAKMAAPPALRISVYIGLSETPCVWHRPDHHT